MPAVRDPRGPRHRSGSSDHVLDRPARLDQQLDRELVDRHGAFEVSPQQHRDRVHGREISDGGDQHTLGDQVGESEVGQYPVVGVVRGQHAVLGSVSCTMVASRVVTLITDDLDGSDSAGTIAFSLEGASYEIDLNSAHAEELRNVLEPYMKAGRKTGSSRDGRRRSQGASAAKDQIKAIRDWAKKQGLKVSDRGRVSADVREAYDKAH